MPVVIQISTRNTQVAPGERVMARWLSARCSQTVVMRRATDARASPRTTGSRKAIESWYRPTYRSVDRKARCDRWHR
jgi:hypothetical protein